MGCISAKGWYIRKEDGKESCVYNDDTNACNYGVGISVIAFIACVGFIAGEYVFEKMSSVKTRKHYVLGDMAFSCKFIFNISFYFITNDNATISPAVLDIRLATFRKIETDCYGYLGF